MNVSGIAAQQAIFRANLAMEVLKSAHKADQVLVDLIAASVDSARGQNLDISV